MAVLPNRRLEQLAAPGTALMGPLPEAAEARREAVRNRLLEQARVSLAVIEGEVARDCLLPGARVAGSEDDLGYDIELCNRLRRGLLLAERLSDLEVTATVWRVPPDRPEAADILLAGSGYSGQFSGWGKLQITPPEEMRRAFAGEATWAWSEDGDWCSVFAPLRDSLDDIVGVLELCAAMRPARYVMI
jgi:hypothetical protein